MNPFINEENFMPLVVSAIYGGVKEYVLENGDFDIDWNRWCIYIKNYKDREDYAVFLSENGDEKVVIDLEDKNIPDKFLNLEEIISEFGDYIIEWSHDEDGSERMVDEMADRVDEAYDNLREGHGK